MEHRLIIGGEQYLPFARSRVKVLRGLGLPYADQSFSIGGVTVRVRIEPGHEYIHIEGGDPIILSGVTRDGAVITLPDGTKALRSYKPTANAWQYPLHSNAAKSPSSFHDEKLLGKAGAQYATLRPTMFSGRMVQAVQILMGRGIEVKYDFRWEKCHGITTGPDGNRWLVEIGSDGVRAMKFGLDSGSIKSKTDAIKQSVIMFGGVPNGKTFPTGEKLAEAVNRGEVRTLRAASRMTDFYGKRDYATTMGWSFNDDGTEAHNTCWDAVTPGEEVPDLDADGTIFTSYHYRIKIHFFINGDPPTAELDLISSGRLTKKQYLVESPYQAIPMYLYDFLTSEERPIRQQPIPYTESDIEGTTPLIACHINGVLEVISVKVRGSTDYSYYTSLGEDEMPGSYITRISSIPAGRSIIYSSNNTFDEAFTLYQEATASAISSFTAPEEDGAQTIKAYKVESSIWTTSGGASTAQAHWGAYARDSVVKFRTESTYTHQFGAHSLEGYDGVSVGYIDAVLIGDTYYAYIDFSSNTVAVDRDLTERESHGVSIVLGHGEKVDVENELDLWAIPYLFVTYSAFGDEQQVSITADGYHRHIGDLLTDEPIEFPRREFTFIGYT